MQDVAEFKSARWDSIDDRIKYTSPYATAIPDAFPSSTIKSKRPLALVHSDLKGPLPPTHSGHRYWITFTDDKTRFKAAVPLKLKSDAFAAFKRYKTWAENQLNIKIAGFRDDKGGEYISREFDAYCEDCGITRQHTTRKRAQQNGVAERINRTIVEGITSMLTQANLPARFWGEALAAFIHVLNRRPSSSIKGLTPHQLWYNEKPQVGHLRVWGCLAYIHVQKDKRTAFGPHFEQGIFMGYPDGYKAWKFVSLETGKVIISERADFDERNFPGLKGQRFEGLSVALEADALPPSHSVDLGGDRQ